MTNPLEQYFRTAKLYVKLPSQSMWYDKGMIETSANDEVAVYPMTALDQINMKTPDALLNGEALVKIVANCVPGVKDPRQLVEPDINTLLLAIRIATAGSTLSVDTKCSHCDHENHHEIDLTPILESQEMLSQENFIDIDGSLVVHLRPYNFEQRNLTLLNEIQQNQAVRALEMNEQMDATDKMTEVGKYIGKMAARTFDILAKSVTHVTILKTGTQVTDQEHINQFIQNITKPQADAIMLKIKEINDTGIDPTCKFICESCGQEYEQRLDFDPISFFD